MGQDQLTTAELRAWQALQGVMTRLPALLDARLKQWDISNTEFGVLWCLTFGPTGTKSMGDLATIAGITPSHLSRVAARLEKRGWMTRRPDPADARSTIAALTPAGRAKVGECLPTYQAALREHLFGLLTADQVGHLHQAMSQTMTSLLGPGASDLR